MAATRLIALHLNKGKSLAQCLKARTDYSENAKKTNNGQYISDYECDQETADEEFLLTKKEYQKITGRKQKDDVIAYQIRQSFKPGEIEPDEANAIGYELAMKFTKGNHAFLVATHIDKKHIHNHIIFNSTKLDGTGKFRDYYRSGRVVRRISDMICLVHGLSVIEPTPFADRNKRTTFQKRESFRDTIISDIERILNEKPKDYETFLRNLITAGYEIKSGKYLAVKGKEQRRFIRFRSLGESYSEEKIKERITGRKDEKLRHPSVQQERLDLLVDIERKLREGKGGGYEKWAKVFNIKQMSKSILFLQDHGIRNYDELVAITDQSTSHFNQLSESIKRKEERLSTIQNLQKAIINYSKTREVYIAYRKAGYSKKFYEEHEQDIIIHKAAKEVFSQYEKGNIPKMKELKEEYQRLLSEKRLEYQEYQQEKKDMREYLIAKKNMNLMLGKVEQEEKESKRREQYRD